ncbi:hypothetical protein PAPYR_10931 [Paratrimastix pyriformis]|uniref:Uncharacterized protein n=1 Tax=Paratrimastix pyriformis TaxID=342808 RepID=A0ABQ8U6R0_9EUKA|nr:hypothetical protein PAPYR_10931 [Paratrimastix pyriformis]
MAEKKVRFEDVGPPVLLSCLPPDVLGLIAQVFSNENAIFLLRCSQVCRSLRAVCHTASRALYMPGDGCGIPLTDEAFDLFIPFANITLLDLGECLTITSTTLRKVPRYRNLASLSIKGCFQFTEMPQLPHLTALNIHGCTGLMKARTSLMQWRAFLEAVGPGLTTLKAGQVPLAAQHVEALAGLCPNLTRLQLASLQSADPSRRGLTTMGQAMRAAKALLAARDPAAQRKARDMAAHVALEGEAGLPAALTRFKVGPARVLTDALLSRLLQPVATRQRQAWEQWELQRPCAPSVFLQAQRPPEVLTEVRLARQVRNAQRPPEVLTEAMLTRNKPSRPVSSPHTRIDVARQIESHDIGPASEQVHSMSLTMRNGACASGPWRHSSTPHLRLIHTHARTLQTFLTDCAMGWLAEQCPHIVHLDIAGCSALTDASFAAFGAHLRLKRLWAGGVVGLTNRGLEQLAAGPGARSLEFLQLESSRTRGSLHLANLWRRAMQLFPGMIDLSSRWPHVVSFTMDTSRLKQGGRSGLTSPGTIAAVADALSLVLGRCPNLAFLQFSSARALTDAALRSALDGRTYPKLRHLAVLGCPLGLTNPGLETLAHTFPGLEQMQLVDIGSITAQGLLRVVEMLPNLGYLTIQQCPLVGTTHPALNKALRSRYVEAKTEMTENSTVMMVGIFLIFALCLVFLQGKNIRKAKESERSQCCHECPHCHRPDSEKRY